MFIKSKNKITSNLETIAFLVLSTSTLLSTENAGNPIILNRLEPISYLLFSFYLYRSTLDNDSLGNIDSRMV